MSWFERGYEIEGDGGGARSTDRKRFWVKQQTGGSEDFSKKVLIVDDPPFLTYEHNPKIGGDFRHYYTCLQGVYQGQVCPMCKFALRHNDKSGRPMYGRYRIGCWTLIEIAEWKDNDGNLRHNFRRLLVVKNQTLAAFKQRSKLRNGLAGSIWQVSRTQKSPAIGDQWDFLEKIPAEQFERYCPDHEGGTVQPFDYEKEFRPMSIDQMVSIAASVDGAGEDDGGGSPQRSGGQPASDDDEVPF